MKTIPLYLQHPREFKAWDNMKTRCSNPKTPYWKNYGGRGIRVCERWKNSFANFLADMGPKPTGPQYRSLDRIDNDGDYEPSNCRWATQEQQMLNTRPQKEKPYSKKFTIGKETKSIDGWAKRYGLYGELVRTRLARGWSIEKSLTTPPDTRFRRKIKRG